ncbi:hypothetical protein CRE_02826 [Caenorhabditis remanei]|uniref:F-box domain-containing protein n=1 Tax=Caenorhabditis remanei TaxID=31234 RepID=E3LX71_CAERE|nr:hypothetical protein CRE_02826 [Caenorhabditis remanei]
MSQHPLKLLHLPLVVLRNVLQFLNPIELFELSQCSRRALSVIPLSGSKNFKLYMNEYSNRISVNEHFFSAYNNLIQSNYSLHGTRSFMETTVKICHRSENELISFWDNRHVGLKSVFFHVSKVFKCPIECAKFSSTCPAAIYMSIIDFISSRQSEIKELYVGGQNLTDEHVTEIFDKLRDSFQIFNIYPSKAVFLAKILLHSDYRYCKSQIFCKILRKFVNCTRNISSVFSIFGLSRSIYGAVNVQRDDGIAAKVSFDDQDGNLRILVLFELSQCSQKATSIISLSDSKTFKLRLDQSFDSIVVDNRVFRVCRKTNKSKYPKKPEVSWKPLSISLTYDNVTKIFDKLRVTDSLEMYVDLSKNPNIPFTPKSISIFYSSWITASHLNAMKHCVAIDLVRTTLSDIDIKHFLENWNLGECPNLVYLSIGSSELTDNFTLFDLPSLQDTVNPIFF